MRCSARPIRGVLKASSHGRHAGLGARRRWCPRRRRWCPRRRRWAPVRIALCKDGAVVGTTWLARCRFRQPADGESPFCFTLRGRVYRIRACEVLLVQARCYRGGARPALGHIWGRRSLEPVVGWGRRLLPNWLRSLWRHGLPHELAKRIMLVYPGSGDGRRGAVPCTIPGAVLEAADGRRGAVPGTIPGAVPGDILELGAALGARHRRAARGHREARCEPRTRGRWRGCGRAAAIHIHIPIHRCGRADVQGACTRRCRRRRRRRVDHRVGRGQQPF